MGRWMLWILLSIFLTALILFPIEAVVGDGKITEVLQIACFHLLLAVGVWREWRRNRRDESE